jgi:hypothetical protein
MTIEDPHGERKQRSPRIMSPAEIERLRDHLQASTGATRVFFEVVTEEHPFADYVADIAPTDHGLYAYTLGGHGIGANVRHPVSLDATIERILEDNKRFNGGAAFTYE